MPVEEIAKDGNGSLALTVQPFSGNEDEEAEPQKLEADLVVLNTCVVRQQAEDNAR